MVHSVIAFSPSLSRRRDPRASPCGAREWSSILRFRPGRSRVDSARSLVMLSQARRPAHDATGKQPSSPAMRSAASFAHARFKWRAPRSGWRIRHRVSSASGTRSSPGLNDRSRADLHPECRGEGSALDYGVPHGRKFGGIVLPWRRQGQFLGDIATTAAMASSAPWSAPWRRCRSGHAR